MYAIIETGGKQYKVKEGDVFDIEKMEAKEGEKIIFDKVLAVFNEKEVKIGQPYLKDAKVEAKILKQFKGKKVTIIKYKRKVRYRRKKGHRQLLTKVKIEKITILSAKTSPKDEV